jgi:hypothetical protein
MMLFLSICSPLLPLIAGWHKRFTCLWYYCLCALTVDVSIFLLKHIAHVNHYWPANIFLLAEFMFLTYYYRRRVLNNTVLFKVIALSGIGGFILHTTLMPARWLAFNYIASSVLNFYYIVLSISGFYCLLKEKKMIFPEQSTFFWANVAVLIYASGNFFIFLLRNSVQASDPGMMMMLWTTVFLSLNILKNILLAIGLFKKLEG